MSPLRHHLSYLASADHRSVSASSFRSHGNPLLRSRLPSGLSAFSPSMFLAIHFPLSPDLISALRLAKSPDPIPAGAGKGSSRGRQSADPGSKLSYLIVAGTAGEAALLNLRLSPALKGSQLTVGCSPMLRRSDDRAWRLDFLKPGREGCHCGPSEGETDRTYCL